MAKREDKRYYKEDNTEQITLPKDVNITR